MKKNLFWHFLPSDKRLRYGSNEIVRPKHTLVLPPDTKIIPCLTGFHASERAIDALQYAPGPIVCRVTLHGQIIPHGNPVDKYAAHGRTVLWMADTTETLYAFSRWCALSVIHLWDAPQVVYDYLNTGNNKYRDAAGAAARAAAWSAAWSATGSAARAAAWSATGSAAWAAAWDAAWSATGSAAWDAARAAAWDAAWAAQNKRLTEMLLTLAP